MFSCMTQKNKYIFNPWAQDPNWTYIRCEADIFEVFWKSYSPIYALSPGDIL